MTRTALTVATNRSRLASLETLAGLVVVVVGLVIAFAGVEVVSRFDDGQIRRGVISPQGFIMAALGAIAILYSRRGSRGLLWATSVLSLVYAGLNIFGSGPLPVLASLLLLLATAISALVNRQRR